MAPGRAQSLRLHPAVRHGCPGLLLDASQVALCHDTAAVISPNPPAASWESLQNHQIIESQMLEKITQVITCGICPWLASTVCGCHILLPAEVQGGIQSQQSLLCLRGMAVLNSFFSQSAMNHCRSVCVRACVC